jgi:DNA-binding CsgD family transcriptional regulator
MDFTLGETDVLKLVAQGRSTPQMADRLRMQRPSVTLAMHRLARKLGATCLADLRRKARDIMPSGDVPSDEGSPHETGKNTR